MFLEEENKKFKDQKEVFGQKSNIKDPNSNIFILLGCVTIFILICILLFLLFFKKQVIHSTLPSHTNISTTTPGALPGDSKTTDWGKYDFGTSTERLIAENISFGYFYNKPKKNDFSTLKSFVLPINVKTDVNNYYDVSRKIKLDQYIDDLNNYGFAVLDKQEEITNNDFFSTYHDLADKGLPIVITNDFIIYYYQNILKDVYKEIEKNVFYEHVWRLNKAMYEIALSRYKKTASEVGLANDPILEGQRLELAYFAMALKLLMPTKQQILDDFNFSDPNKFTAQEADAYSFLTPEFLTEDIDRETKLIGYANKTEKSPIMLYSIGYSKFLIPENYKANAKLTNFYLTLAWMKNVFPLYYKNPDCEECLLDKDDWILNLYAACSTSRDLSGNQDLKNQWAIIYKFISFFSGLRQDLTYLNYHEVLSALFGKNYNLEKIFSLDNPDRGADLQKIQEKISLFQFSAIEGSIDRSNMNSLPEIGMRILQEDYWPNDYIFKELSGDSLKLNASKITPSVQKTACTSKTEGIFRCSGFGFDVINLIQPITQGSQYFKDNTNYIGYPEKISNLRQGMGYFNQNTWNNNIYWLTLDVLKPLLEYDAGVRPAYSQGDKWHQEKDYQTALGAWVNLHLVEDVFVPYSENNTTKNGLGSFNQGCNSNNYIELNPDFLNELLARNVMLLKMLSILKIDKDTNAASLELKELNIKLEQLLAISDKLINNQTIGDDDCRILDDFARHYAVEKKAKKSFSIDSTDKKSIQNIENIKLLALIYNKDKEKYLVFGPIFDYKE